MTLLDDRMSERRTRADQLASSAARRESVDRLHGPLLRAALTVTDAAMISLALLGAHVASFGLADVRVADLSYWVVAGVLLFGWLGVLGLQDAYDPQLLGVGADEYKRVVRASVNVFALTAILCFLSGSDLSRLFVGWAVSLGLVLLLAGRFAGRFFLVRARRLGRLCHRVIVLGDRAAIVRFVASLETAPAAGYGIVGACLPNPADRLRSGDGVESLGVYEDVADAVRRAGADVVAVTASESITPERLRSIAWSLEGLSVDLVVAPAVTDVAGPRVRIRPVAGLPLLYVNEPQFTGVQRLVKGSIDRFGAVVGLLLLAPVLLVVGLLVRWTSSGPALFRQARVGRDGRPFSVLKFRTMSADAEQRLGELAELNEGDGLLFKIAADPRITPLGRVLRKTSIDELPQLINVLRGEMSLVGPRPLAVEGDAFVGPEQRRHLVKPGITGLWQVSGRAEQSWEDAVRLDLYYVENWSLATDLVILLRTVLALFRGN